MNATELQSKLLRDHAHIGGKVGVLRSLAAQVLRGDEELGGALQLKGRELEQHLIRHMDWEEEVLLPVLRQSGVHNAEVADVLSKDHEIQRTRLAESLVALSAANRQAPDLATEVLNLLHWIDRDMRTEEARLVECLAPSAME